MALSIQEILESLKIIDGLKNQIEAAWGKIKAHAEEVKDEEDRQAIIDACDRRDADYLRRHLFM